jgi:hypothetical protein
MADQDSLAKQAVQVFHSIGTSGIAADHWHTVAILMVALKMEKIEQHLSTIAEAVQEKGP